MSSEYIVNYIKVFLYLDKNLFKDECNEEIEG